MTDNSGNKQEKIVAKLRTIIDRIEKMAAILENKNVDVSEAMDILKGATMDLENGNMKQCKKEAFRAKNMLVEQKKAFIEKGLAETSSEPMDEVEEEEGKQDEVEEEEGKQEEVEEEEGKQEEAEEEEGKQEEVEEDGGAEEVVAILRGEESSEEEIKELQVVVAGEPSMEEIAQTKLLDAQETLDRYSESMDVEVEGLLFKEGTALFQNKDFAGATEKFNEIIDTLSHKMEKILSEEQKKARDQILDLQQFLAPLEDRGVELGETWELYEKLALTYRDGNYGHLDKLISDIKEKAQLWDTYDRALLDLLGARKQLGELKERGIDISALQDKFNKTQELLDRNDYHLVNEAVESILQESQDNLFELDRGRADASMKKVEELLKTAEDSENDVTEQKELFKTASKALENRNIEECVNVCNNIIDSLQVYYYQTLVERFGSILARAYGLELKVENYENLFIESQGLGEDKKYATAVKMLEDNIEELEKSVDSLECIQRIKTLKSLLTEMMEEGHNIDETHEMLLSAREEMENENYLEVRHILDRAESMAERTSKAGGLKPLMDETWVIVHELGEVGMDMDNYKDKLYKIEQKIFDDIDALKMEDFAEKVKKEREEVESMKAEVLELQKGYPGIIQLIQSSQFNISKIEDNGGDVEKLNSLFKELVKAFENCDMEKARKLGEKCDKNSENKLRIIAEILVELDETKVDILQLEKMGAFVESLNMKVNSIQKDLKDKKYKIAHKKAKEVHEEVSLSRKCAHNFLAKKQIVNSKLLFGKKLGINVENLQSRYLDIEDIFTAKGASPALDEMDILLSEVVAITKNYEEAAEYIQKAQEYLFSLKDRGIFLKKQEDKFMELIPLLDENHFENAIKLAKDIIRETKMAEKTYSSLTRTIGVAQGKITREKKKGTVLRSIVENLKMVGELMDQGELENALERVENVLRDIKIKARNHDGAAKGLKLTWERLSEAKSLGIDTSHMEKEMEGIRNFVREGKYLKSIEMSKELGHNIRNIITAVNKD